MPSLKIDIIVDDQGRVVIDKVKGEFQALDRSVKKVDRSVGLLESSFAQLGIKTEAAYNAQRRVLERAYQDARRLSLTDVDRQRATEAYHRQLSRLNAEQERSVHLTAGATSAIKLQNATVEKHTTSMASLVRGLLRWYAAYYVASNSIVAFANALSVGVEAVEKYNMAITTMAALVTSSMELNPGETLAQGYQRARDYAGGLVKNLEQIDKHTTMNLTELIEMSQEMIRQRVILDTNNKEAVEGFTNVANALSAMIGNVPDRMRQINQEIRALLTGQTKESDKLAKSVASMTPDFENQLQIHKKIGDVWQWLGKLLVGFSAAQSDIDKSWQATKSTLETIWQQILRDGFGSAYKDITDYLRQIAQWVLDHKEQIAGLISNGWNKLKEVVLEVNRYLSDLHVYDLLGSMFSILGKIVKVMWEYRDAVVAVSVAYAAFKITAWITGFQALTTAISAASAAMTAAGGIAGISGLAASAGAAITGLIASLGALINPITLVGLAIAGVAGIVTYGYLEHSKAVQELENYKNSLSTMSTKELNDQLEALTELEKQIRLSDHAIGGFVQTLPQVAERWKMVTDEILRRQPETLNFLSQMAAYFNSMANAEMPELGSRVELPKSPAYKAPSFVEDVISPGAIAKKVAAEQSAAMLSVANASPKTPKLKPIVEKDKSIVEKDKSRKYANTLRQITDETTRWQNRIAEMNPALEKQDSEILKLTNDAEELIKRIQDQGAKAKVNVAPFISSIKESLELGKEYIGEKERLKYHDEYLKMVSEEADFAATENERAINKIIAQEEEKLHKLVDIWASGAITDEEADRLESQIRDNSMAAQVERETENARKIADINYNLVKDIKGLQDWAYELRIEQIKAQADVYRKEGADEIAIEQWKQDQILQAQIAAAIAGNDARAGQWAAYQDLQREMVTTAEVAYGEIKNIHSGMKDGFSSLFAGLRNESFSWSDWFLDFTNKILSYWDKMLAEMLSNWIMFGQATRGSGSGSSGLLSGIASLFGFGTSVGSTDFSTWDKIGSNFSFLAHGDVFPSVGSYSNSVVSNPTMFRFAHGVGLMGEAGSEAIMPLTRTSSGDLGVKAVAGENGGTANIYHITINAVDSKSFEDALKRNPNAVISVVSSALNNNTAGLRNTIKRTTR